MTKAFDDKVVLVTGASRGIGKATALAFASQGASLVLAARSARRLDQVRNDIHDRGGEAISVPTDITSTEEVAALVDAAMTRYGRIDVLVNNAGIGHVGAADDPRFGTDLHDTLQASLFGAIRLTQQVLPILRRQQSGSIVNMSSVMGRKAFARFGGYAIVMHGVSAFTDALRQELAGTNIAVSVIHPALTATDLLREVDETQMPPPFRHMTPLSAEEVGEAVVKAVRRGTPRVILPRRAGLLLLGEAVSPRLGDLIASALTRRPLARLMGFSRGRTYHQTLAARTDTTPPDTTPRRSGHQLPTTSTR
ncbi:oxidoreductase [Mycolicibacterium madagascariense]|uniref:Oxidoreductase n=1 Tax=Mycolicibacterium madagascariense TaxID=212765 RepID=A0A7I7XJL2_9MYCO|nr:SDR family oxidoreductase [Mycolicibacterium madagascariense]MCV7015110.1 SDR family oxidoreductase [Mycolicibacterium madagascariense]BBZ29305.1 oxidoreductase [Mycolicibacterium madagascariense]